MRTGNEIVDAVGQMSISGNVIPQQWFRTIIRDNGKPNLTAIVILSDIVYWYRPTERRDEQTGRTVAVEKRFKSDLLQRSYAQISEQFGITKREATAAVTALENLGIIRRHFRTIEIGGVRMSNVLFIELIPEGLYAATYDDTARNEIAVTSERERVSRSNVKPLTPKRETNTEITTETTTEKKRVYGGKPQKRAQFEPPTLEEVEAYIKEKGYHVNAAKWYAHYEANGWKVGRNKMKDWHAAVRTWEYSDFGEGSNAKKQTQSAYNTTQMIIPPGWE